MATPYTVSVNLFTVTGFLTAVWITYLNKNAASFVVVSLMVAGVSWIPWFSERFRVTYTRSAAGAHSIAFV